MPKLDLSILKPFSAQNSKSVAHAPSSSAPPVDDGEMAKKLQIQALQIELLNLIVERYRKFIEEGETKSLEELKTMVRPLDATVTELKIQIEDQFHPYSYESNYLLATQKAMDTIFSWKKIKMPLSFWMSFEDMARLKAADDLDRAIILCSVFRALGSDSARVLIGKDKSAWVSFAFSQKTYIASIGDKTMSAYPAESDTLKQFMYSIAYMFNDRDLDVFEDNHGSSAQRG